MPEAVLTPALIERHTPIAAPPFFSVEYLHQDHPPRWEKGRAGALVMDYMEADQRAMELGEHVFASTVVTPMQRAREIAPRQRSQAEDWRARRPNCGVI